MQLPQVSDFQKCPCCGAPFEMKERIWYRPGDNRIYVDGEKVTVPFISLPAFELLLKNMPQIVLTERIYNRMYPVECDNPANPEMVKKVIHDLRRSLKPTPLKVINEFAVGYRMEFEDNGTSDCSG